MLKQDDLMTSEGIFTACVACFSSFRANINPQQSPLVACDVFLVVASLWCINRM